MFYQGFRYADLVMEECSSGNIQHNGDSNNGYLALNMNDKVYFHLAVDGHTFAAIMEHNRELFKKV